MAGQSRNPTPLPPPPHRAVRGRARWAGRIFVQGLAAVVPVSITLYILWWIGSGFEALLGGMLQSILPEGWYGPGYGILLGILIVFVVGALLQMLLARQLYDAIESQLERLPLIKTIYGPLKDLMSFIATSSKDRKRLKQVVRVDLEQIGVSLIGFMTRESASELTDQPDDSERVSVYLPMSYQIGGYMVLVPRSAVRTLDMGIEQVLRMTMTAGMSMEEEENGSVK
jgi:uncharacterized membrane protein